MDKKTRLDLLKILLPSDNYDALRYIVTITLEIMSVKTTGTGVFDIL